MKKNIVKTLAFSALFFGFTQAKAQMKKQEAALEKVSIENVLAQMDENKDEKISFEEAQGPMKLHFNKLDANKDGFLTADEIKDKKVPKMLSKKDN